MSLREGLIHLAREQRINSVLEAIEAFVEALIRYDRHSYEDPEWADPREVNETRKQLSERLSEVLL